ncbi:hypothetical protein [methanotrophic endosymbiont of Bathymodiolus puteoserpentis (Logatchev)]|uniref:hypothetical protein n=1 Tax=methanotrophic endosymbiont of Bathymodiolus puteoserpentis (Logatchev) TaxID=343235 RepID=UPI001C2D46DA|nr:hypothetical protein [methanotrophic endosymbiont of Bathymodiolus puteoserpentis (Logatchev)]
MCIPKCTLYLYAGKRYAIPAYVYGLRVRQVEPKLRGGDRRSELFKKKGNINRV